MSVVNFTGLASGIDSNGIIDAILTQQRNARIKPLQTRSDSAAESKTSFNKLKELLSDLNKQAQSFREINGGAISRSVTSSNESRISASATNSAASGTYEVTVAALAKNANTSFNDRFTSTDAVINSAVDNFALEANRTVGVTVGTGGSAETVAVAITNTTTVSQFVTEFNSKSSKAEASVVNVGTSAAPSYAVVINSLEQGVAAGNISFSVGSEVTGAGSGAFASRNISQASDASFTLAGILGSFTRSSNTVSDVVPGLTLNLNSLGTATVSVRDDSSTTETSVSGFVDAFNKLQSYIAENDLVTTSQNGDAAIFGTLSGTSIDENILSSLRNSLAGSAISGGSVNTLSELGITTERDGSLKFDAAIFEQALAKDPNSVRQITSNLGESLGSVNGVIAQYSRFQGIIDGAINGIDNEVTANSKKITSIEDSLTKQELQLRAQYARLESVIGRLNSSQSALTSALAGLR